MLKICFLVSGGGGNMKFMHLAKKIHKLKDFELSVIADRDCASIEFAEKNNIQAKIVQYSRDNNKSLVDTLQAIGPDIIITTWAKIIDKYIVKKYLGKMINLHYSLLPAFAGQMGIEPIENAYKQNCQYVGVTCHHVDENVDTGEIISQAIVQTDIPIEHAVEEVFRKGCLILLNSIMIVSNQILLDPSENDQFHYSPRLTFDEALFDEAFWKKLSTI